MAQRRVLLGEFGRPHGVRGLLHVRSHTAEPSALAAYGPLSDESGARRFVLHWLSDGLVRVEGVEDRDAAARLTGTRLYLERERLPEAGEEEYYLADLLGLAARAPSGEPLGEVVSVEDHGAGAYLTLRDARGRERTLPFTREVVTELDPVEGRLTVRVPAEVEALAPPAPRPPFPRRRAG